MTDSNRFFNFHSVEYHMKFRRLRERGVLLMTDLGYSKDTPSTISTGVLSSARVPGVELLKENGTLIVRDTTTGEMSTKCATTGCVERVMPGDSLCEPCKVIPLDKGMTMDDADKGMTMDDADKCATMDDATNKKVTQESGKGKIPSPALSTSRVLPSTLATDEHFF